MVDIPDDIDLVDYDEEDPEDEPEEDVNIELEDDAELIFPYEVEGDKTPPPGDVSSDSVSSDSKSEDEEVDVALEATVGTITQKPYAIRDFPRGLFEVGESSSARDSSHVDGLAPWALRRDLEASHAQARVMEAELEWGECHMKKRLVETKTKGCSEVPTSDYAGSRASEERNRRTLLLTGPRDLPSHNKIGEKERELLNHDLENVERALGNVLERMSVLKSGENDTLKKRLAKTETKVVLEPVVMELVVLEPVLLEPVVLELVVSDQQRLKLQGFEKLESVFRISVCKERDKVKFATATLQGRTLTWWNGRIASMGIDAANGTLWAEGRDGYTNRFQELALLCSRMVEPEQVKVEQYIRGLSKNIRGDVTSSRPTSIDEAVRMSYQHMEQIIQDKTDEASEGEKRKCEGDRGSRGDNQRDYNHRQNQRMA
ncbi:hypothetical protein Tco_1147786, partial [Tanacetum coccineum]